MIHGKILLVVASAQLLVACTQQYELKKQGVSNSTNSSLVSSSKGGDDKEYSYTWRLGNWQSGACQSGQRLQTRTLSCQNSLGQPAADSNCTSPRPTDLLSQLIADNSCIMIPDDPIDPTCSQSNGGGSIDFLKNLQHEKTTALCGNGFAFNEIYTSFQVSFENTLSIDSPVDIDYATYTAPDGIDVFAVKDDGSEKLLFSQCRIRTHCWPYPNWGSQRPYEDTIRRFNAVVPRGTKAIRVDLARTGSPSYFRMTGLCGIGPLNFSPNVNGLRLNGDASEKPAMGWDPNRSCEAYGFPIQR